MSKETPEQLQENLTPEQKALLNLQNEIVTAYAKKIKAELNSEKDDSEIAKKLEEELKKQGEKASGRDAVYDKIRGNAWGKFQEFANNNGLGRVLDFFGGLFGSSKQEEELNEAIKKAATRLTQTTGEEEINKLKEELGLKKEDKGEEADDKGKEEEKRKKTKKDGEVNSGDNED